MVLDVLFASLLDNPPENRLFQVVDAMEEFIAPMAPRYRVGPIIVIGNDKTPQSVILDQVPLYPGNRLYFWRLGLAEFRLSRLGLFELNPDKGIWPRVNAIMRPGDSQFKDLVIELVEKE